ncbi:MAG: 3D domain-containing protein [Actinomycetia bacterium]|nr:3D domain-containing protein [Actinomycetes bacterium]
MERMVYTYKYGNDEITKFVLSAKNLNEVVNNLYLFKNIMERDAELIEEYRYEREEFDRVSRKSEEKKVEVEQTRERVLAEQQKLQQSIAYNQALLDQVKNERSEVATLLSEIKKRIAQVQPPGLTLVGEWDMVATAYYSGGGGLNGNGITAIGLRVRKGIVAVDPKTIPLGTRLYIPGYGEALAADTGGWIKGNRIDLGFESLEECYRYGRRKIKVYLVDD